VLSCSMLASVLEIAEIAGCGPVRTVRLWQQC
jgi:hypothetical protein